MTNAAEAQRRCGLAQIDAARWEEDHTGTLNLKVSDSRRQEVHAWMTLRPQYCDRGHIQLNIDGIRGIDGQDAFPRYFFSFAEADRHARDFLKWRLWKHRVHDYGWGETAQAEVLWLEKADQTA